MTEGTNKVQGRRVLVNFLALLIVNSVVRIRLPDDANAEDFVEIEDLLQPYLEEAQRDLDRLVIYRDEVRNAEMTVSSPDRMVEITQTMEGRTLGVKIARGAFERYDEASFAELLKKLLDTARIARHRSIDQLTDRIMMEREGGRR